VLEVPARADLSIGRLGPAKAAIAAPIVPVPRNLAVNQRCAMQTWDSRAQECITESLKEGAAPGDFRRAGLCRFLMSPLILLNILVSRRGVVRLEHDMHNFAVARGVAQAGEASMRAVSGTRRPSIAVTAD
jgi:hypothetical protein